MPSLRRPESFRSWVCTIAVHQVSAHRQSVLEAARHLTGLTEIPEATGDFEELTILHLRLLGQRREVAWASRWLDDQDRVVLSLWWLETVGEMTRGEVAAALETTAAYAAVRIQRMRTQLEASRSVVAALAGSHCGELGVVTAGWDTRPSALWRKRIARHVRDCQSCLATSRERIAAEQLLVGYGLVPVPPLLAAAVTGASATAGTAKLAPGHRVSRAVRKHPAAIAATALVVLAAAVACAKALPERPH